MKAEYISIGRWTEIVGENGENSQETIRRTETMKRLRGEGVVFWVAGRPLLPWDTIVIPLRTASIRSGTPSKNQTRTFQQRRPLFFFVFRSFFLICANRPGETVGGTRLISLRRLGSYRYHVSFTFSCLRYFPWSACIKDAQERKARIAYGERQFV